MAKFLGTFGLDYCDMPTMLSNVNILLRILTVNIFRYNEPISWVAYIIFIMTAGCYIYVYIISALWYILFRYPETGNLVAVIIEISLTMCSVTCVLKIFYIKINPTSLMNLVDVYLYYNEFIVKNTRFEKRFLKNLKVIKKRAITIWILLYINMTIYNIIMPLITPGRHLSEDLHVIYGLEPMFDSPNYEIAFIMMTVGVLFVVVAITHVTLFIIVTVGGIEAQMIALSEELCDIWDDSEKFYNIYRVSNRYIEEKRARNIFIEGRLQHIVKFQIINMNLREKIENELSLIFIIDFVVMIIAVVTELVGGLENTFLQMSFTLAQVIMACLIGQWLIDAGEGFEKAVYSCKWENFNVSNQKTILLILQCSQKTLKLSAGGISVLDLLCLMSIFKFIYSAYTSLKSAVQYNK